MDLIRSYGSNCNDSILSNEGSPINTYTCESPVLFTNNFINNITDYNTTDSSILSKSSDLLTTAYTQKRLKSLKM